MEKNSDIQISEELLTQWAESCIHMNHLGTLIQRELSPNKEHARAIDLAERMRRRAWTLLNELFEHGAQKPDGYREPAPADSATSRQE
jgi:hypothetical protein